VTNPSTPKGASPRRGKKGQSKESREMSYAFQRKGGPPLTKAQLNEMLKDAVERTPAPPPDEDDT
jgi:hypothetical protein